MNNPKIIREINGETVEFELTDVEVWKAHAEYQKQMYREDIDVYLNCEEIKLTDEQFETIVNDVYQEHRDNLWWAERDADTENTIIRNCLKDEGWWPYE